MITLTICRIEHEDEDANNDDQPSRVCPPGAVEMRTKILMMMKFRRFCRIECEDEDKNKVDQPSRVCSPGAVGGVNLEGTRLSSDEPVKLVQAGVLKIEISI